MEILEEKQINLRFIRIIAILFIVGMCINLYFIGLKENEKSTEVQTEAIDVVDDQLPVPFNNEIEVYSEMYGLDPYLVAAIIKTESGFNKDIVSSMGAVGLMQIMPSTGEWIARQLNIEDFSAEMLKNEDVNIEMGCWYLNYLRSQLKHTNEVLAAYNGGIGNVFKWLQDPRYSKDGEVINTIPFKETVSYIEKVVVVYNEYMDLYRTEE
ncbi:lytic transglycosylase domain-containing protein [Clostridium sp. UBA1056]|uniref:lytic transglycosylase domain-containing protein n=1 Tax=unclassified Clostridium TaxID=2614128 RepID=UPI003216E7C5